MGPELDLRPRLERLDRLICWSEGIDEGALSFAFRPLRQLDEPARAALAIVGIGRFLVGSDRCHVDIAADAAPVRSFGDDGVRAPSLRDFVAAIAAGRFSI